MMAGGVCAGMHSTDPCRIPRTRRIFRTSIRPGADRCCSGSAAEEGSITTTRLGVRCTTAPATASQGEGEITPLLGIGTGLEQPAHTLHDRAEVVVAERPDQNAPGVMTVGLSPLPQQRREVSRVTGDQNPVGQAATSRRNQAMLAAVGPIYDGAKKRSPQLASSSSAGRSASPQSVSR